MEKGFILSSLNGRYLKGSVAGVLRSKYFDDWEWTGSRIEERYKMAVLEIRREISQCPLEDNSFTVLF